MGRQRSLVSVRLAAVDTAPFIYLFEGQGARYERAVGLFGQIASADVVTSIITPIEILTYCVREQEAALEARYVEFFHETPHLEVHPVDWEIGRQASSVQCWIDKGSMEPGMGN